MADRSIVYGARYYLPGRRVSHFHLYRLRPDGTGRLRLTRGKSDDFHPAWSPDGHRIAFFRQWQNGARPDSVCMIPADGGPVRTIFNLSPDAYAAFPEWLSDTRLLVHLSFSQRQSSVVVTATGRVERTIRQTWENALSPDRTHLIAWSDGDGADVPARIVRLRDGRETALPKSVGVTCAWLDDRRFVALGGRYDQPALTLCTVDGKVERTVTIRRSDAARRWEAEVGGSELDSAAFLDPLPGSERAVLVGWQLGGSQQGSWAATYRVDLASGEAIPWAETKEVVPAPDRRRFLTTRPRALVPITDSGEEWGAPLLIADVGRPGEQRELVGGQVYVVGFDWRGSR